MRSAFLLLLLGLSLALPARAQVAARLDDLRLATAVRIALVDDVRTRPLEVEVNARSGSVEFDGEVPAFARRTVAEVAQRVPGVRRVEGLGTLAEPPAGPTVSVPPARPAAPAATPLSAAEPVYHTVQRGDTLFSLARRYETTVEAILALNRQRTAAIQVGQRLRVR